MKEFLKQQVPMSSVLIIIGVIFLGQVGMCVADTVYDQLTVTGDTFLATDTGNVGVGTADPAYKLHINGNTGITTTGYRFLRIIREDQTNPVSYFYFGGGNGSGDIRFSTRPFDEDVEPTEVMRWRENGKVGIGTADPAYKLHINGNLGFTTEGHRNICFKNENQTNPVSSIYFGGGYGSGDIRFSTRPYDEDVEPTEVMRWRENGRVGLGTAAPQRALHIYSEEGGVIKLDAPSGAGSGIDFSEDGVYKMQIRYREALDRLDIYSATVEENVFSIKEDGNVVMKNLSGSGTAYACVDSSGQLFRSNEPCN